MRSCASRFIWPIEEVKSKQLSVSMPDWAESGMKIRTQITQISQIESVFLPIRVYNPIFRLIINDR
jgi:hypothetical protein